MTTPNHIRFIQFGTKGTRNAWTSVAKRSRFEQIVLSIVMILVALPIFLFFLGFGMVVVVVGLLIALIVGATAWIKRRLGAPRDTTASLRENVRVISRTGER